MRVLAAAAAAAILAGCSGSRPSAGGRAVFERSCSGCHTITGHDTKAPGGDLRVAHLTAFQVASFARVMPVRPPLDRAETQAVARFVAGGR